MNRGAFLIASSLVLEILTRYEAPHRYPPGYPGYNPAQVSIQVHTQRIEVILMANHPYYQVLKDLFLQEIHRPIYFKDLGFTIIKHWANSDETGRELGYSVVLVPGPRKDS